MVDAPENRSVAEAELIRLITDRCDSRCPPSELEVHEALERGCARLCSLEAQLQRAAPQPSGQEELRRTIDRMRAMLAELRARSAPPPNSAFTVGGFVLPSARS